MYHAEEGIVHSLSPLQVREQEAGGFRRWNAQGNVGEGLAIAHAPPGQW